MWLKRTTVKKGHYLRRLLSANNNVLPLRIYVPPNLCMLTLRPSKDQVRGGYDHRSDCQPVNCKPPVNEHLKASVCTKVASVPCCSTKEFAMTSRHGWPTSLWTERRRLTRKLIAARGQDLSDYIYICIYIVYIYIYICIYIYTYVWKGRWNPSFVLLLRISQGLLGLVHFHQTPWSECQSCQRLRFDFLLKVLPKAFLAVVFRIRSCIFFVLFVVGLKVSRFWAACGGAEDRGLVCGSILFCESSKESKDNRVNIRPVSSSLSIVGNHIFHVILWGCKKQMVRLCHRYFTMNIWISPVSTSTI